MLERLRRQGAGGLAPFLVALIMVAVTLVAGWLPRATPQPTSRTSPAGPATPEPPPTSVAAATAGAFTATAIVTRAVATAPATPLPSHAALPPRRAVLDVPVLSAAALPTDTMPLRPSITPTLQIPGSRLLDSVGQVFQTLNNCGPASVAMVLAYYGHSVSQAEAQASLRPDPDEWGMLPDVVAPYVEQFGLDTRVLDHGTPADLKTLLNQGVPVIVTQWLSEADPIPHYRVIVGYDDVAQAFIVNDGVLGFGQTIPYGDFEGLWDVYANLYLPVFPKTDAAQLHALLGSQWDRTVSIVSQSASRPAWDEFLRAGGLSAPAPTPDGETPTPTPAPTRTPNTRAETAWPLTKDKAEAGELVGSTGGAYLFYSVTLDKDTQDNGHIDLRYTPDDPAIGHSLGVKLYDARGDVIGEAVNTSGLVGTRSVALPGRAGTYLVQVYNYLPDVQLEFSLTYK